MSLRNESTRAYLYRVALAVFGLMMLYGLLSEAEVAGWAALVQTLLGLGVSGLATRNTSTSSGDTNAV